MASVVVEAWGVSVGYLALHSDDMYHRAQLYCIVYTTPSSSEARAHHPPTFPFPFHASLIRAKILHHKGFVLAHQTSSSSPKNRTISPQQPPALTTGTSCPPSNRTTRTFSFPSTSFASCSISSAIMTPSSLPNRIRT